MSARFYPVLLLLVALQVESATIYKCVDSSGKMVFSDKECSPTAEAIEYKHPETFMERHEREMKEAKEAREKQQAERDKAFVELKQLNAELESKRAKRCQARHSQSGLSIGMSKSEIYASEVWGAPDDISTTTTESGIREYLVYVCEDYGNVRLFVANGKLTSIHR